MKKLFVSFLVALFISTNMLPFLAAQVSADGPLNLIANPSMETASGTTPQSWLAGGWGTNTSTLSYPSTGHTGSRSVEVQTTSYTNGDAKWYFAPVAVSGGTKYTFSDYYKSSVATTITAQFDNGAGSYTYQDLTIPVASTTWNQATTTFTTPATAKNVTIFHLINKVGTLTIDDASLTAFVSTAPAVSITAPSNNATVSGTATLNVAATDSAGIAGVQYMLDGVKLGSEVTTSPYSYTWNSTTTTNGAHSLTAVARNIQGTTTTSVAVSVTVSNTVVTPPVDPTPPVNPPVATNLIPNPSVENAVSNSPTNWLSGGWGTNTSTLSYATNGQDGSHSLMVQTTSYTNGDAKWYFAPVAVTAGSKYTFSDYYKSNVATGVTVQFDNGAGSYSYLDIGAPAASATDWKQFSATFTVPTGMKNATIFHLINKVGTLQTDNFSLTVPSAPVVSVTNPAASTTVSGTINIAASASDSAGIKNVQFNIDGKVVGTAVTTSPYSYTWNTTTVANGTHSIAAVATNTAGTSTTSAPVSVTVSNTVVTPPTPPVATNLIPNPSLETVSGTTPQNWMPGSWGTNTTTSTYLTTGHTGSRSVRTAVTGYSSGSSYWYSTNVAVKSNQMYNFSDYYKSNIISEVDAAINLSDGTVQYLYLGDPSPSPNTWTKFSEQFTTPANAVSVSFYHNIYANGNLTTDDYSLTEYSLVGFNRPIVSLTFDDGWASSVTNGLPILQKYGLSATDYIITGYVNNDPNYITTAMLNQLYTAGHEIGSHTVTHPDLTTLTAANMDAELKNSQTSLQTWLGVPITSFASPYGAYSDQVVTNAKKYYANYRGVQAGYNSKNNFDAYNIRVQNLVNTTTVAQVQSWVDQAIATNTWLVLVYHQVDNSPASGDYNTYPADLDAQLAYIKAKGVAVETVKQALAELTTQL